jgi:hypothetical protein
MMAMTTNNSTNVNPVIKRPALQKRLADRLEVRTRSDKQRPTGRTPPAEETFVTPKKLNQP